MVKPVNSREARLIFASGIGWTFDAMDVLLLSYILVAASHELGLTKGDEGLVILANNVGMLIGAFLFGWLADLWGRRRTFMLTLALYSVGVGLTAFASSASDLAAIRLFTGLGLGGELPVAASLVSELSPPDRRGGTLCSSRASGRWARYWPPPLLTSSSPASAGGRPSWRSPR
jgi:Arabinose efflux permease